MATPAEIGAMRRAIALSAAGLGTTSPNPPVGCVLVDVAGLVVGEGYHERKGEAHAETKALAAAGERARGATAVVTLEPCNHEGRTPACRQALIDAGIRRAVIAVIDPTSRGEGGAAALRAAGVDVETGILTDEARLVLGPWLTALAAGRPVIIWPYVISGSAITPLPAHTDEARMLRTNADAVLYEDGSIAEAIPAAHGAGILSLERQPAGADASNVAAALHAGGVRQLILSGGLAAAAPFLAAGLIDRVLAYLPDRPASRQQDAALPWPLVPPGYAITSVTRITGYVRTQAEPAVED